MIVKDLQADYNASEDKQFGFSVMASRLIPMESLSDRDFRVLAALISFFDIYGETFISNEKLADICGKSLSAIKRSLHDLNKNGFIRTRVERKGKLITRRYISETALLEKLRKESKSPKMDEGKSKNAIEVKPKNGLENKSSINKTKEYSSAFNEFWVAYPRKINKKKAWASFQKIEPKLYSTIMHAISQQIKTDQWTKDGGKFIPHPTTWLNGERWDDEVTTGRVVDI